MLDWSVLNIDVLILIAEKLEYYEEFKAFAGVCTLWRRATGLAREPSASRQTPWLLLPTPQGSYKYRFQGLNKNIVLETELPFNPPRFEYHTNDTCNTRIFSSRGWLIYITTAGDIFLVHPLFKTHIQPPPVLDAFTCLGWPRNFIETNFFRYCRFSLSDNPLTTSNYTLSLALCYMPGGVVLWRCGDNEWTMIINSEPAGHVPADIYSYMGAIYTVDYSSKVFVLRNSTPLTPPTLVASLQVRYVSLSELYLVELASVLFLIVRELLWDHTKQHYMTSSFNVWEVNTANGVTKKATNLRNKVVFVGFCNSSFSTDAFCFQNCKPNCIYYAAHRFGMSDMDMGVFDLTTGRQTEGLYDDTSSGNLGTSLWVESSLMHVYK